MRARLNPTIWEASAPPLAWQIAAPSAWYGFVLGMLLSVLVPIGKDAAVDAMVLPPNVRRELHIFIDRDPVFTGWIFKEISDPYPTFAFCYADAFTDRGVRLYLPIADKSGDGPVMRHEINLEDYRGTSIYSDLLAGIEPLYSACVFAQDADDVFRILSEE